VTATDFAATSGTLSHEMSGLNGFAHIVQSGNRTATGTFTITATQTVTLAEVTLRIAKVSNQSEAADLDFALTGTNTQFLSLVGAVPSAPDPRTAPVVRIDFADFTLDPGQTETFTFSVTALFTGRDAGLLLDDITVTPVPIPESGAALAVAGVGLLGWVLLRRAARATRPVAGAVAVCDPGARLAVAP
jgi:hypothetical protein